jgi:hypothetical protein
VLPESVFVIGLLAESSVECIVKPTTGAGVATDIKSVSVLVANDPDESVTKASFSNAFTVTENVPPAL